MSGSCGASCGEGGIVSHKLNRRTPGRDEGADYSAVVRVADLAPELVPVGSVMVRCCKCGALSWLGPLSQRRRIKRICAVCINGLILAGKEPSPIIKPLSIAGGQFNGGSRRR